MYSIVYYSIEVLSHSWLGSLLVISQRKYLEVSYTWPVNCPHFEDMEMSRSNDTIVRKHVCIFPWNSWDVKFAQLFVDLQRNNPCWTIIILGDLSILSEGRALYCILYIRAQSNWSIPLMPIWFQSLTYVFYKSCFCRWTRDNGHVKLHVVRFMLCSYACHRQVVYKLSSLKSCTDTNG